jgi:uncharacterized membrane protein
LTAAAPAGKIAACGLPPAKEDRVKLLLLIVLLAAIAYFAPAPVQHVEQTVEIAAPRDKVWEILGDASSAHIWDPGMKDLKVVSDMKEGVGTTLEARGALVKTTETVKEDILYNRLAFDVKHDPDITRYETSTLSLNPTDRNSTSVKWEMDYQMSGGYLGHFADQVLLGSVHGGRISDGLSNLKRYAETGETPVSL